jgi:hypothetical protein
MFPAGPTPPGNGVWSPDGSLTFPTQALSMFGSTGGLL